MRNVDIKKGIAPVQANLTRDDIADFNEVWAISERLMENNREAYLVLAQ